MKVEGDRVTKIDRQQEKVSIPSAAKYIGQCAFFNGFLSSLDLEGSNIIIIEEYAFSHCYQLKEVTFPSCLQDICEGAFFYCKILEFINFGSESKLTKIGTRAFEHCKSLGNIEFPPLLEIIGNSAFDGCKIRNFDLSNTKVRQIGSFAFSAESSVSLPATVTPKSVLNKCDCEIEVDERHQFVKRDECGCLYVNGTITNAKKGAKRFLIRRGVERIGQFCFYKSNLVSLTIPSSVTKISNYAFSACEKLKFVHFAKNSRLNKIGKSAFKFCLSLKKIKFPKSLKVIKSDAFLNCESLEDVSFPDKSMLERIEGAFPFTRIRHLSLPQSIREIENILDYMDELESVHLSNDLYSSNEEGSAIFSKDGSELVYVIPKPEYFKIPECVCVIHKPEYFKIPEGVCVIRKNALMNCDHVFIPSSVEIIEEYVLNRYRSIFEFAPGSKLRSLDFEAFDSKPGSLVINNENFITMYDGVVMSLNPRGIVFVPEHLTEIEIDPNVEVIYSNAFQRSSITSLHFPKSLKKIFSSAFSYSELRSITFEEGTDLETFGEKVFTFSKVCTIHVLIKGKMYRFSSEDGRSVLELPRDFSLEHIRNLVPDFLCLEKIICPRSSLLTLAQWRFLRNTKSEIDIIEDQ